MIIGNGLVARSLEAYKENDAVLVFASGVSNSSETDHAAYLKEKELLKAQFGSGKTLVYFSTISILEGAATASKYIDHKRAMEAFISENAEDFLILRLPNLIGKTPNPNTFFNFFRNKIEAGETITGREKACRYFMDAEDLSFLLPQLLAEPTMRNSAVNVAYSNKLTIPEAVHLFEKSLKKKAKIQWLEKGECFTVSNGPFMELLKSLGMTPSEDYNANVFRKYLVEGDL